MLLSQSIIAFKGTWGGDEYGKPIFEEYLCSITGGNITLCPERVETLRMKLIDHLVKFGLLSAARELGWRGKAA